VASTAAAAAADAAAAAADAVKALRHCGSTFFQNMQYSNSVLLFFPTPMWEYSHDGIPDECIGDHHAARNVSIWALTSINQSMYTLGSTSKQLYTCGTHTTIATFPLRNLSRNSSTGLHSISMKFDSCPQTLLYLPKPPLTQLLLRRPDCPRTHRPTKCHPSVSKEMPSF
jgi:hypothetical protein